MYYVYLMTNWNNEVLYVGVTRDVKKRVREHKLKVNEGFTSRYNVSKLVYYETYGDVKDAIRREKEIKGWKRNRKNLLVALENPTWSEIKFNL